jgi:hypothetical protein
MSAFALVSVSNVLRLIFEMTVVKLQQSVACKHVWQPYDDDYDHVSELWPPTGLLFAPQMI